MWVRLQPGWYSDFGTVNSDDFILTSLALLSCQWTDTTRVAFGGYYSRDLGEERLLPALGFIFEPDAHWSLALTFPRVELAYAPNKDVLFAACRSLHYRSVVGISRCRHAARAGDRDHRSALPLPGRSRQFRLRHRRGKAALLIESRGRARGYVP